MMKETIIKVEGMVCNGCENRVQNALKTIERNRKCSCKSHKWNSYNYFKE